MSDYACQVGSVLWSKCAPTAVHSKMEKSAEYSNWFPLRRLLFRVVCPIWRNLSGSRDAFTYLRSNLRDPMASAGAVRGSWVKTAALFRSILFIKDTQIVRCSRCQVLEIRQRTRLNWGRRERTRGPWRMANVFRPMFYGNIQRK